MHCLLSKLNKWSKRKYCHRLNVSHLNISLKRYAFNLRYPSVRRSTHWYFTFCVISAHFGHYYRRQWNAGLSSVRYLLAQCLLSNMGLWCPFSSLCIYVGERDLWESLHSHPWLNYEFFRYVWQTRSTFKS